MSIHLLVADIKLIKSYRHKQTDTVVQTYSTECAQTIKHKIKTNHLKKWVHFCYKLVFAQTTLRCSMKWNFCVNTDDFNSLSIDFIIHLLILPTWGLCKTSLIILLRKTKPNTKQTILFFKISSTVSIHSLSELLFLISSQGCCPSMHKGVSTFTKEKQKEDTSTYIMQTNTTVDAKCWAFVECSMFIHMLHTPFKHVSNGLVSASQLTLLCPVHTSC